MLRIEIRQIWNEILHHRHGRQRIDAHRARDVGDGFGAGERVAAGNVHGAGAADAFTARAAESERRIDLVLDLDERVENHWPAGLEVNPVDVGSGIFILVRIVAIDLEVLRALRLLAVGGKRRRPDLALFYLAALGQRELNHRVLDSFAVLLSKGWKWGQTPCCRCPIRPSMARCYSIGSIFGGGAPGIMGGRFIRKMTMSAGRLIRNIKKKSFE